MPVRLLHLDIEMVGSFFNVGKREIPFGISDVLDLFEPRHRIASMRCICHRLFACAGKCEGSRWQRIFLRRGKAAVRCRAMRFPSRFRHIFTFHYCSISFFILLRGCSGGLIHLVEFRPGDAFIHQPFIIASPFFILIFAGSRGDFVAG